MKRFEGRNLDEALENASKAFNVERYRLSYHVVLEKRGFLGGMKRVVVEADINESATPPAQFDIDDSAQPPLLSYESDLGLPREPQERGPRRGRGRRGAGRSDRGRGGRSSGRRPMEPRMESRAPREVEQVPEQTVESEAAKRVREWFEEMFDLGDFDLILRTEEADDQLRVRLYGRDAKALLAHGGELLDSMQVLANKALVGRSLEKGIELDCREFKQRRMSELGNRARAIAEQVRRDGREQMLEAMNPIERRIVHLALQDDGEVATESRGEGFYKRIAIVPRKHDETPGGEPAEP